MVSFQEGSELLQKLAGVVVDAKQVERAAEALGEEIAADNYLGFRSLPRMLVVKLVVAFTREPWSRRRASSLEH